MEKTVEQQEIQAMDFNSFAPSFGLWAEKFRPFIESKDMYDIYQKLKTDAKRHKIVPLPDDTFKVFQLSSPADVRAIFYLMDPYPRRYQNKALQATGIAMDCANSPDGKLQPSLEKFYDAIDKELSCKVQRSPNLDYLVHQGVLLLNSDFTCKLNMTGSHEGYWDKFQKFFLEEVMRGTIGIPYILSGKASQKLEKYINPLGNNIFKIEHPSFAERMHKDWDSKGIFKHINNIVKEQGKKPILWDRRDWEKANEPPF